MPRTTKGNLAAKKSLEKDELKNKKLNNNIFKTKKHLIVFI